MDICKSEVVQPAATPFVRSLSAGQRVPAAVALWNHSIVMAGPSCYFRAMNGLLRAWSRARGRVRLPTSEGFAKLSDHARLPGRFFYRMTVAGGR